MHDKWVKNRFSKPFVHTLKEFMWYLVICQSESYKTTLHSVAVEHFSEKLKKNCVGSLGKKRGKCNQFYYESYSHIVCHCWGKSTLLYFVSFWKYSNKKLLASAGAPLSYIKLANTSVSRVLNVLYLVLHIPIQIALYIDYDYYVANKKCNQLLWVNK